MEPIGKNDVLAFLDVLNDLATEADTMDIARALEVRGWLDEAKAKLLDTAALVNARALTSAKEPVRVGDTIFHTEPTGKWRPNHSRVREKVVGRAIFDENGESVTSPEIAARRTYSLMMDLFVAPKDMPKNSGLVKLGLKRGDVADWEHTGNELKTVKVKEPEAE